MKNKIIIGAIVVLAAALIFENAYLLGRYKREKAQNATYVQYRPVSVERLPAAKLPVSPETLSWDPFAEINRMQQRISRIFEDSFSEMPSSPNVRGNKTSVASGISFSSTDSAYTVKVTMPGIAKDDINIQVKGRQLIISGENKKDKTSKDKDSYSRESSYGNFLSDFMLPEDAQVSRIASDYKDGVLTITIPRQKQSGIKNE